MPRPGPDIGGFCVVVLARLALHFTNPGSTNSSIEECMEGSGGVDLAENRRVWAQMCAFSEFFIDALFFSPLKNIYFYSHPARFNLSIWSSWKASRGQSRPLDGYGAKYEVGVRI